MKRLATLGLVLGIALAAAAGDAKKFDAAKLVGDWTYVEGMRGGEKIPEDRLSTKVTFTKDTVRVPAGKDATFLMAYKLNPKETPVAIDLEIKDGPVKEGKAVGIIALDGDKVQLCYVAEGGARPKKFESTKDNNAFLFVLKRAK